MASYWAPTQQAKYVLQYHRLRNFTSGLGNKAFSHPNIGPLTRKITLGWLCFRPAYVILSSPNCKYVRCSSMFLDKISTSFNKQPQSMHQPLKCWWHITQAIMTWLGIHTIHFVCFLLWIWVHCYLPISRCLIQCWKELWFIYLVW